MADDSLPQALVIEVLSMLPVKSLLRFKCVCKSWYDLIISPTFVSKHLINSDSNALIVGHGAPRDDPDDYMILSSKTLDVISDDFRFEKHNYQFWSVLPDDLPEDLPCLLGSYNGLVCLANEQRKMIAFWNPATKQYKIVRHILRNKKGVPIRNYAPAKTHYAFGYDFKTNDYKVMGFNTVLTHRPHYKYKIDVYSLNAGSWRNSDAVFPAGLCLVCSSWFRPSTCVNGTYSTMVPTYGNMHKCFLFTIDMSNEEFILTPLPPEFDQYGRARWEGTALTKVKESVAIILARPQSNLRNKCILVSVLNKYGPDGTWTKLYTLAPLSELLSKSVLVGFWRNGLILQSGYHPPADLVLCDPKTHEVEIVEIGTQGFQILEYKESLVCISKRLRRFRKK